MVSFADTPGWTLTVRRDAAGRITGAAWTGQLAPERFVEFGIIAVNPTEGASLRWSFVQTYADGVVVRWSDAPGSRTPASIVTLQPDDRPAGHH